VDFLTIWERITLTTELKKLVQLAEFIGVSQAFVSKKKKEQDFPIEWAFKIAQKYKLSTDWLITGEDPRQGGVTLHDSYFADLEEWGKNMSKSSNLDWMKNQIDATFPMFKEARKKKREAKGSNENFSEQWIA
jgi:hypothetical protein